MQAIRGLVGEVAEADPVVAVGVISNCKAEQRILYRTACRALGVFESWFYKWRDRPPTAREARRQQSAEEIGEIFHGSGGTCGSPKVFIELARRGWRVSVNTVAKVMAELGPAGGKVRRRRLLTRPGKRPAAPDFVRRDFTAEEPDLVWAGDLTDIETGEGKLYSATVIDLFSRHLLGYAMAERHDADLVVASLDMAAATRGGDVRGVIMHTDRGSEGGFNWSSQHFDLGGVRRGHGGPEFEGQRCSGGSAPAVAR
ncbi:DDE-type integrase/transposase/recombinase [Streptomyces sp. TG1A-8]|uniref:DDE-type integrase/transposase/recombinase n=1 Tax=Streptomyces sp. TG1A-8 TaxID=3051385 RepID=UPI00265B7F9C|nr:DDE-type integrase/transposase/recombinase [Streptomyces sp. TG1A-8]MDO0929988.1 DDE-type integrase/transposase/recombinase [Streptomyces sp. TG1A-8]